MLFRAGNAKKNVLSVFIDPIVTIGVLHLQNSKSKAVDCFHDWVKKMVAGKIRGDIADKENVNDSEDLRLSFFDFLVSLTDKN